MRESRREEWGMLLPFLYLTYILRSREEHEDPNTCRVVDVLSDILCEEEMKEKKEDTEEQDTRKEQEGV